MLAYCSDLRLHHSIREQKAIANRLGCTDSRQVAPDSRARAVWPCLSSSARDAPRTKRTCLRRRSERAEIVFVCAPITLRICVSGCQLISCASSEKSGMFRDHTSVVAPGARSATRSTLQVPLLGLCCGSAWLLEDALVLGTRLCLVWVVEERCRRKVSQYCVRACSW